MFQPQRIRLLSLAILVSLGSAGCASNVDEQSDFYQQAKSNLSATPAWQQEQAGAVQASYLTDLINEPGLSELVNTALQANPSVHQTLMTLKTAKAQRRQTNGERLPDVSAGLTATKSEDSQTSYTGELSVSWELDLWQKLADDVRAAEADVLASQADYQGVKDTLAANVMQAWLEVSLQQQLLAIENARIANLNSSEALIKQRYRKGIGELADLDSAATSSASANANIAAYEENLAEAKRALAVLLGDNDVKRLPEIPAAFSSVQVPLAGLPEQDLSRRPDLQSAWATIQAEQSRAKVAYKDLLPSFSLEAALSQVAENPSDALLKSPAWSLLGQLTAPLFSGGKLRAAADSADYSAEQSYWAFQETLLDAVKEVEDGLGQEQSLTRQQQHIQQALTIAQRNASYYQSKYRKGLVDVLDMLEVQEQTYDLQAQLAQLIYDRLVNRINLGLALGLGVSA